MQSIGKNCLLTFSLFCLNDAYAPSRLEMHSPTSSVTTTNSLSLDDITIRLLYVSIFMQLVSPKQNTVELQCLAHLWDREN